MKIVIVSFICLHAFNVDYAPVSGGLDPSWQYIINYAASQRIEFSFTSGPFGFINYPMNVGHNIEIAIAVRVLFWFGLSGGFLFLVLKNVFPFPNLLLFAPLFALSSSLSFDYLVCLVILAIYFCAVSAPRWLPYVVINTILSGVLGLMKLSAAMLAIAASIMFIGVTFFQNKRKALQAGMMITAGIPLIFCSAYLLYDPSWSRMIVYVQRSLDISAGYNVAMSATGRPVALWLALAIAVAYLVFIGLTWRRRDPALWLALIGFPALFFAFKHGFIRQDGHENFFFLIVPALVGLILLFTRLERCAPWEGLLLLPILIPVLLIPGYTVSLRTFLGREKFIRMQELLNYTQTKAALSARSQTLLQRYHLPQPWLQKIDDQAISIFPWEAGYAPANNLNFRPFPVIQAYSAYTPRLDLANADFLDSPERAPEFVLLEWIALNDRHPLMDVPAMWFSLYNWYDGTAYHDPSFALLLMQRRTSARFQRLEPLSHQACTVNDFIEIPSSTSPVIMKIGLKLNLWGLLAKILFRVPEVDLELVSSAGHCIYRVVPDTLQDGLIVNVLPLSLEDVYSLTTANQSATRVYGVKFSGEGLPLYQQPIQVEFAYIPEIQVADVPIPDFTGLSQTTASLEYQIDRVTVYKPKQWSSGAEPPPMFLIVNGWAIDSQTEQKAGGVYLDIDGVLYPTYYGFPSDDLVTQFQEPAYGLCGFQAGVPLALIGKGQHTLQLKILTFDRQAYESSANVVSFEIN